MSPYGGFMLEQTTPYFTPATFELFELDDVAVPAATASGTRWFPGFSGQLGHPAESVALGWRAQSDIHVSVTSYGSSMSGRTVEVQRFQAVFPLQGAQFAALNAGPEDSATFRRLLDELPRDMSRWRPATLEIDGTQLASEATQEAGDFIAYAVIGERFVTVTARGLEPTHVRLRTLADPAAYALDPTEPHDADELNREWAWLDRDRQ